MFEPYLNEFLPQSPAPLPPGAAAAFAQYLSLLNQWQSVVNLSAIKAPRDQVIAHIMDGLSILPYLKGERFIDVGSGAGVPGLMIAIAKPTCHVTLLDVVGKKTQFLQQVKASLKLKNVEVVHGRVESFASAPFDGIITRAFSDLAHMVACTQHLCAPGGRFYAMKGQYPAQEIAALPASVRVESVEALQVPGLSAQRHVIILKKQE